MLQNFNKIPIILLIITLFMSISASSAATTYQITGQNTTAQIQSLIDTIANPGDTIDFAENIIYNITTLSITKSLNIISSGGGILDGKASTSSHANVVIGLKVLANNVNITGLTMKNYDLAIGNFGGPKYNNANISSNVFNHNAIGIFIAGDNIFIYNNTVNDSYGYSGFISDISQFGGYGITVYDHITGNVSNATYLNNIVNNSKYGIANYASNSLIMNNWAGNNKNHRMISILPDGRDGIANTYSGKSTKIINNTVENNYNNGIRNDCDDVLIENNTAFNNSMNGIKNQETNHWWNDTGANVKINNNTVYNNTQNGIYDGGYKAKVSNNTVYNNKENGIHIASNGTESTVENNKVYNNQKTGIYYVGKQGKISNNEVYKNNDGIYLNSSLISLNGNNIRENTKNGLYINYSNNNMNVFNNTIKLNGVAIYINGSNNFLGNNNSETLIEEDYYNEISENIDGTIINGNNNIIKHLNLYNNSGTAVIILGNNNTIESSNVINNRLGFNITGNNSLINYNRIYNNTVSGMINDGLNTNANLNWWGKNNITTQYIDIAGDINVSNWFIIKISANDFETIVGGLNQSYIEGILVNLKASLVLNNESINYNKTKLPPFIINYGYGNNTISGDIRITDLITSVVGEGNMTYILSGASDDEYVDLSLFFIAKEKPVDPVNPIDPVGPIDPIDPNPPNPEPNNNETNDNPKNPDNNLIKANALMKETGIPIIAVIFVLLASLGLVLRKK